MVYRDRLFFTMLPMPESETCHTLESDKIQLFSHTKYIFVHLHYVFYRVLSWKPSVRVAKDA